MKRKKDIEMQIMVCERRIDDLDDAMDGKLRIPLHQMERMVSDYVSPMGYHRPSRAEIEDAETRWLAMMADMARTLLALRSLEADLAAMESKASSRPLPMIPFFDDEVAEDERSFVACYVEWRCM